MKFPARSSNSAKMFPVSMLVKKVTVQPQVTCGECYPLPARQIQLMRKLEGHGLSDDRYGFRITLPSPAKLVLPLPDSMSFDQGAMIEPLAVAVHAIRQFGDIRGKNVAVIGAGPLATLFSKRQKAGSGQKSSSPAMAASGQNWLKNAGPTMWSTQAMRDLARPLSIALALIKQDVIYDCAWN